MPPHTDGEQHPIFPRSTASWRAPGPSAAHHSTNATFTEEEQHRGVELNNEQSDLQAALGEQRAEASEARVEALEHDFSDKQAEHAKAREANEARQREQLNKKEERARQLQDAHAAEQAAKGQLQEELNEVTRSQAEALGKVQEFRSGEAAALDRAREERADGDKQHEAMEREVEKRKESMTDHFDESLAQHRAELQEEQHRGVELNSEQSDLQAALAEQRAEAARAAEASEAKHLTTATGALETDDMHFFCVKFEEPKESSNGQICVERASGVNQTCFKIFNAEKPHEHIEAECRFPSYRIGLTLKLSKYTKKDLKWIVEDVTKVLMTDMGDLTCRTLKSDIFKPTEESGKFVCRHNEHGVAGNLIFVPERFTRDGNKLFTESTIKRYVEDITGPKDRLNGTYVVILRLAAKAKSANTTKKVQWAADCMDSCTGLGEDMQCDPDKCNSDLFDAAIR